MNTQKINPKKEMTNNSNSNLPNPHKKSFRFFYGCILSSVIFVFTILFSIAFLSLGGPYADIILAFFSLPFLCVCSTFLSIYLIKDISDKIDKKSPFLNCIIKTIYFIISIPVISYILWIGLFFILKILSVV